MNANAPLLLGSCDDFLTVEVGRRMPQVDSIWRGEGMLGFGIRISVDCCGFDAILSGCPFYSSVVVSWQALS